MGPLLPLIAGPIVERVLSKAAVKMLEDVAEGKLEPKKAAQHIGDQIEIGVGEAINQTGAAAMHEESKVEVARAKMRPGLIHTSNRSLGAIVGFHILHAVGQALGFVAHGAIPPETMEHLWSLTLGLLGVSGTGYGVRTIENGLKRRAER